MSPLAFARLLELVIAERSSSPYPDCERFVARKADALGQWPKWLGGK
jgi:hypothetical protein